jgi:hypothetical protein
VKIFTHALAWTGALALSASSHAQAPFGNWVHDNTAIPLAIYVSPSGSNANSGLSPSSPLQTLDVAVQQADFWLSILFPLVGKGVTINAFPGNYVEAQPVSVPAWGIAIEPYRDLLQPGGVVNVSLSGGPWANRGTIEFDRPLGPNCQSVFLTPPSDMPASVLRGFRVQGNSSGHAVRIDPTANVPDVGLDLTVEVEINQCELHTSSRGLRIENTGLIDVPYACVIVDNRIHGCALGVDTISIWDESNLFRSNWIYDCHTGMRLTTQCPKAGRVWPRILSNAIWDMDDQFGIEMQGVSAQVVNNTIAFVTGPVTLPLPVPAPNNLPASIGWFPGILGGAGETLVFANNILFSPPFAVGGGTFDPREIQFGAPFTGALTLLSNDFDASGTLTTPPLLVSATNVPIATPNFANMTTPFDVHLTAASPSVTNLGDQTFVVPGATASLVVNGTTFPAHCALEMDLDARTHQTNTSAVDVLHRGADQFVPDGIRLRAPTAITGQPAHTLADAFGAVVPGAGGTTSVWIENAGPNGSFFVTVLCFTLPMTPEMQHIVVTPFGSLAIDPAVANAVTVDSGFLGATPTQTLINLGTMAPTSLEAEMYLQSIVFRPNGTASFSNRIRIDADGL